MFSGRIALSPPNALSLLLDEKRRQRRPLVDLTLSNPTTCDLPYPRDLLRALADPRGLVYEPSARGDAAARQAISARLGVAADDLLLTASTSEAYGLLFKLLCDPGDAVLIPEPSYPLFPYLTALEGVAHVPYPLAYDGEWHIDVPALRAVAAATPRARAILVVSPGNPTGAYLKRAEAAALAALCAERGLALVADEVFAEFPHGAAPGRVTCLAREPSPALAFSLGGLSKSLGLPQLKLAWIAAGGPAALRGVALERLELIADSYLSVATPIMLALPRLFAEAAPIADAIRGRLAENRATLAARVAGTAATLYASEGGWSAILRLPATRSDEELAIALLRDHDVVVHPGYFFDLGRGTHLVLSLLARPSDLARGLDVILSS